MGYIFESRRFEDIKYDTERYVWVINCQVAKMAKMACTFLCPTDNMLAMYSFMVVTPKYSSFTNVLFESPAGWASQRESQT